jgi:hypothetical protein
MALLCFLSAVGSALAGLAVLLGLVGWVARRAVTARRAKALVDKAWPPSSEPFFGLHRDTGRQEDNLPSTGWGRDHGWGHTQVAPVASRQHSPAAAHQGGGQVRMCKSWRCSLNDLQTLCSRGVTSMLCSRGVTSMLCCGGVTMSMVPDIESVTTSVSWHCEFSLSCGLNCGEQDDVLVN